jgi:hypothetical protein
MTRKHSVPVVFDQAARLALADVLQHLDPPAAAALRSGVGLTIHVKPEDAPTVGGVISRVGARRHIKVKSAA